MSNAHGDTAAAQTIKTAVFFLAVLLAGVLLPGCKEPIRALVTDVNGLETEISGLQFSGGGIIKAKEGQALRQIRTGEIGIIKISAEETESIDGEIYYLAELWLVDGSQIIPRVTPDGERIGAFINVMNEVYGITPTGDFRIKLRDVKQIKFLRL
jgi:hypothetical protein